MIKLIVIGKTRELFIRNGINEYIKRLTRFCKLEYLEVNKIDNLEFENLVVLDVKGIEYSSEGLAEFIKKNYIKDLNFLIGDEDGISEDIRKKAKFVISLSKMTFTHEFARLIFIEQLYRAFTINNGMKYHK